MRLIFASSAAPHPSKHTYSLIVRLPESKNGWALEKITYKTPEAWLNSVRKILLSIGIDDSEYLILPPNKEQKDSSRFEFFFKTKIEELQFRSAIFGNIDDKKPLIISSMTPDRNYLRMKSLNHFCIQHEIDCKIFPIDDLSFEVIVKTLYDRLAIEIQAAKGTFDKDLETPSPHIKALRAGLPSLLSGPSVEKK